MLELFSDRRDQENHDELGSVTTTGIEVEVAASEPLMAASDHSTDHLSGTESELSEADLSHPSGALASQLSLAALVEGVIFASPHPVPVRQLAEVLNFSEEEIRSALLEIEAQGAIDTRGIQLVKIASGYQLRTKPDLKVIMAKFYEKKPPRLTQPTMEVLAIIAYKQPITRPEMERIRGVDCTGVLKTLLDRELIEMRGRADLPGHPVVYGTTAKFLEWFQINAMSDLPPLSEMELLNKRFEEGTGNLIELLNKDEGFTSESIQEMDSALQGLKVKSVDDLLGVTAEAPSPSSPAASEAPSDAHA